MKLHTYREDSLVVSFVYSPFYEMACSLHVLCKPDHHLNRLNWASEMKKKLPDPLFQELLFFDQYFDHWLGVMDFSEIPEEINDLNLLEVFNYMETIPMAKFRVLLCNGNPPPKGILMNEALRKRLVACMKLYFYTYFEPELRYIEPLLIRIGKKQAALCEQLGARAYFATLHNRLEVNEDQLIFHKYRTFTFSFDTLKNVQVGISSFIQPHLMLGTPDESSLHLTYHAALQEASDLVPVDLVKTLKALGDETRLKILRSIRQKPSSTQSLAAELQLTEACISKHLKLLAEADLLFRQRKGNYVYYLLDPLALDRIPMDIYQYID